MKLVFYNHYGNGDLFESREFVRDWMRLAGVKRAEYAHRRLPGFFADLPEITSVDVTPEMNMRAAVTWADGGKTLLVNTWVGRDGRYVVNPGIGCVIEEIHRMHNDQLLEARLPALPRTMAEYLPTIDYTRIKLGRIPEFVAEHYGEKLVLLCNGPTGSGQASNFDMVPMVDYLPQQKGVHYIFTQKGISREGGEGSEGPKGREDVSWTDDLTGRARSVQRGEEPESDLNAISYLSRFCAVIAGRCSGAQMPCQVLENWMDSTKTLVCFTHHRNGACFVLNPLRLGLRMKVVWSPAATSLAAAGVIRQALN